MANENQTVQFFHPVTDSVLLVSLLQGSMSKEVQAGYKTIGSFFWKNTIPVFQNTTIPTVKFRVIKNNHGYDRIMEDQTWETDTIPKNATQRMQYWISWAKTNGFVPTPELT